MNEFIKGFTDVFTGIFKAIDWYGLGVVSALLCVFLVLVGLITCALYLLA